MEYLQEIEEDVLGEVGNIILNDCMGVFTQHLGVDLDPGIPVVDRVPAAELLQGSAANLPESQILVKTAARPATVTATAMIDAWCRRDIPGVATATRAAPRDARSRLVRRSR